jgi:polyisoprenoid-binding protein YceI
MHLARLTVLIGIAVASFMGGAAGAADKYALDPMHTFVVFKIMDMGYAHVVGWFTAVAGELTSDPADVTKSALNVRIKTASIDGHFAQRNKDLMSPDFLNVAEFPEMTFKSTSSRRPVTRRAK